MSMQEMLSDDDLLRASLTLLDAADLAKAGAACRRWRAVASENLLWIPHCVRRWPITAALPGVSDYGRLYRTWSRQEPQLPTAPDLEDLALVLFVSGREGGAATQLLLKFAEANRSEHDSEPSSPELSQHSDSGSSSHADSIGQELDAQVGGKQGSNPAPLLPLPTPSARS